MQRAFEILPGFLAWTTLLLMVVLSRYAPIAVAIFIILFDIYWLLKTIYLSLHLRSTFQLMQQNLKTNWLRVLRDMPHSSDQPQWEDMYHLIIFPMANEPYEVVRDSFRSLAAANYPKEKFFVVLALEERTGAGDEQTAEKIQREFGHLFGKFLITHHPADVPHELPGKGSNETWAGKEAKRLLIDATQIPYDRVLVSVFDIDTQIFSEYFGRLTHVFLTAQSRLRAIYQPIPFFTNNIYQAPALARVVAFSATFWQMMQQSRPERLTSFSSQSIPLAALVDIGFWATDVVSEDSRIFWQGYLRYRGDFRCEPLFYPVSMDANVAPTFWQTMKNLYKQQRRWGWGVENVPYAFSGFLKDPLIPRGRKWYWIWNTLEGFHSWATNALMIFALGWLPVLLGGEQFNNTLLSYNLPNITRFIINLSTIGIATSAIMALVLLPPRPTWFRKRYYGLYFLQWLLMPITLVIFGCIPGLEAQTRLMIGGRSRLGFWITPKGRYSKLGK